MGHFGALRLRHFYRSLTIKDDLYRMRVYGPNGTTIGTAASAARRTAGGTFTLTEAEAPQAQTATVALRALGGIDALIALQGIEEPAERRRRAVKYGRR